MTEYTFSKGTVEKYDIRWLRKLNRIYFKNLRKPCEPTATSKTDVPETSNENSTKQI